MSLTHDAERVVHMPANPAKFTFDNEVAQIFDNMAERSIPMFREAHAIHARLARPWAGLKGTEILDIGASRGAFLLALDNEYGIENLSVKATDISPSMVDFLAEDYPSVEVEMVDITTKAFLNCTNTYDVVNCTYVLQFVPKALQRLVLARICNMVKPGGVLFMSQKTKDDSPIGKILHEEYISWRIGNGYTQAEIDAKSAALAGSMWPAEEKMLLADIKSLGMTEVVRTCSWGPFSSLMCIKR